MRIVTSLIFTFALVLMSTGIFAQEFTNTRPGEIMVQMNQEGDIDRLLTDYRAFELTKKTTVSERFNIFLLSFDTGKTSGSSLLSAMQRERSVANVQLNHTVSLRELADSVPNDELFTSQWALNNTGQNGGVIDADIDAPEAWEFGGGGLTAHGDTIVIAILDGGSDLNHEDLKFWKNTAEIPNNSIDDDSNGYVDDYDGWNAYQHSGHIPLSSHGVHVGGIAGASGNNGVGVAGVNWDARILPIAGESTNEATVVEALSYIYVVRETYDQTNGEEGAFVVVNNNSFGVNKGQPEAFPIWEAMYDSLGDLGILSIGATANANWDIDSVGDIPTAFETEYMISVTNTTNKDQKNTNAGYGLTTIDMGAPGTIVGGLLPQNKYGTKSGTSMATPHVAGAVAFLFSLADSNFMAQYKNDPGEYALQIREHIINSVDTLPALEGITVTGGRLNLYKSATSFLGAPIMSYAPDTLSAELLIGDTGSDTLLITNAGGDTLNYVLSIDGEVEWLSLAQTEGSLTSGESDEIEVIFNSTGMDTGYYEATVIIDIENGGSSSVPVQMFVYSDVGISNHLASDFKAVAYPNPFSGSVTFEIETNNSEALSLQIFDQSGRMLLDKQFENVKGLENFSWDGSNRESGLYFYKIQAVSGAVVTGKILKL